MKIGWSNRPANLEIPLNAALPSRKKAGIGDFRIGGPEMN
jgi:hypothetical protein